MHRHLNSIYPSLTTHDVKFRHLKNKQARAHLQPTPGALRWLVGRLLLERFDHETFATRGDRQIQKRLNFFNVSTTKFNKKKNLRWNLFIITFEYRAGILHNVARRQYWSVRTRIQKTEGRNKTYVSRCSANMNLPSCTLNVLCNAERRSWNGLFKRDYIHQNTR